MLIRTVVDTSGSALALDAITKTFDGFRALDHAHVSVRRGEVHGLLGENGAGKSSLMNVAAGLYAPDSGQILLDGTAVTIDGPLDARTMGIGMVHQHYKLVKPFNAIENILLSDPGQRYRDAIDALTDKVREVADELGFELDVTKPVGTLSIAEQQRVEILKVLVGGAWILILDEPTAVLTDAEGARLLETVRALARGGHSVVLVTHKLNEAIEYCDRITVMRGGRTIDTVDAKGIGQSELTTMIVGADVHEHRAPSQSIGAPVLQVNGLRAARGDGHIAVKDANFNVRSGEIYGIAGVGGNGQTELSDALSGLTKSLSGTVMLGEATDITDASPEERREDGLAAIPADRHSKALAGSLSVADNFAIGGVMRGRFGSWMRVRRRVLEQAADEAVTAFDVQGVRSLKQRAALLSGGNAQKLVIAREFSGSPRLIVAHSPARGLDLRASAAVHERLRGARDAGAGVLLISEDLDEILLLCDRIGVMTRGQIVAEFDAPFDRQSVGEAMIGHG